MTMNKFLLNPLFDGLQEMLAEEDYCPSLTSEEKTIHKHAKQFLLSYRGSLDTFNSYRREIERYLQWCQLIAKKSILDIRREDFENFLSFCQDPPESWIATRVEKRFMMSGGERIPNPEWKPFVVKITKAATKNGGSPKKENYELSEKAFKSLFAIISSFYNFLIQEEATNVNPVLLIRQKSRYIRKHQTAPTIRRLSELQWGYVIETAEIMANENPQHKRTLFMMNLLYGMYLRISELAATPRWTPTMGDFHRDSEGRWWFLTVGKGNKERKITVSPVMLEALKQYRMSLGLSSLPSPQEKTPLISKHNDGKSISSTRYIREIVQTCFDRAGERLRADNQIEEAEQLMAATVHWLRHTGISEDVKIRPREHVRDDAGHSSGSITDKYIDVELHKRHESGKQKRIRPEFLET
ncbi:MAG: site-specific integrase [Pseudomonadota bacterium]